MGNTQSSQHTCIDWLAKGPLAPHVDAYKQYLTVRGYAATTFANCIRSITHFAQWIHGRRLPLRRIDEAAIRIIGDAPRFLEPLRPSPRQQLIHRAGDAVAFLRKCGHLFA